MSSLEFPLSRLTWPSGMVRERACVAIARLLIDPTFGSEMSSHLLRWIGEQSLETMQVVGLLPFFRAKIESNEFQIPTADQLTSILHCPSILSWILVHELTSHNQSINWRRLYSKQPDSKFVSDPFFREYSKSFLPPIYAIIADKIESETGAEFTKQWSFEWQSICEELGKKPSTEPVHFRGREDCAIMAFDSELSEVYRSAYLRVLAWAVDVCAISEDYARVLALKTLPIDTGLWQIRPSSKPDSWPEDSPSEINDWTDQIWLSVSKLWDTQKEGMSGWRILQAGGRVHEGADLYDLDIFGVFKRGNTTLRELSQLVKFYRYANKIKAYPVTSKLSGQIGNPDAETLESNLNSSGILPAACKIESWTIPRWQYWRGYRGVWITAPYLGAAPISIRCCEDGLIIRDRDVIIGKWRDWTTRLTEKASTSLSPSTGQYLIAPLDKISSYAENNDLVFSWICCITKFHHEHFYEQYKTTMDIREFPHPE